MSGRTFRTMRLAWRHGATEFRPLLGPAVAEARTHGKTDGAAIWPWLEGRSLPPSDLGRLPLPHSGSDRLVQLLCKPQFNE